MADRLLVRARRVLTLDAAATSGEWLLVEGERIAAVGSGESPAADTVEEIDGVVIPGFIDAHVHLTHTGLLSAGVDLRSCRSVPDALAAIKEFMQDSRTEWLLAGNFDPAQTVEGRMPDRRDLDTIAQFRAVWLSRIDGHCSALTGAGMSRLGLDPGLPGVELDARGNPNGILVGRANEEARRAVLGALTDNQLRSAQLAACRAALERGVTAVHEMAGSVPGDRDVAVLRSSAESLPIAVRVYLATLDVARAQEAGLDCAGGDLLLDGSLGSKTAALGEPYQDGPGTGLLYHDDEEITRFFAEATQAGLQAGVHAIGDAAVEQAIRCLERAAGEAGPDGEAGMRRLRHRIEHAECLAPEQIPRLARLGVVIGVQPTFDRVWGGSGGMYERRLGPRAAGMNPFRLMLHAGLTLAGGSDSPVTPLDPLAGVAAAASHHVEGFRTSVDQALRMFTMGGALAGREEADRGSLEAGKRADFCVLSNDPSRLEPDEIGALAVLETWVGGQRAWSAEAGIEGVHAGLEWQRGGELPQTLF